VPTSSSDILVINSGSSSLKFSVLNPESEQLLATGIAERLGTEQACLNITDLTGEKRKDEMQHADHRKALLRIIEILEKAGPFDVKAVGHRIVHGGEDFREAALITEKILLRIEALAELAPLHNPAAAQGIRIAKELFPGKPQIAVFDTAFHQTLPPTHLEILHPELDTQLNEQHGQSEGGRITTTQSGLLCLVIKTNEELMIARETARLTS
jgi:acetate kinase